MPECVDHRWMYAELKSYGIKQKEICFMIDRKQGTVSDYFTGKLKMPESVRAYLLNRIIAERKKHEIQLPKVRRLAKEAR